MTPPSSTPCREGNEPRSLEALLAMAQTEFRSTLLEVLDDLWLSGTDKHALTVQQLNAINAATCELRVQWGLKGWRQPPPGATA